MLEELIKDGFSIKFFTDKNGHYHIVMSKEINGKKYTSNMDFTNSNLLSNIDSILDSMSKGIKLQ